MRVSFIEYFPTDLDTNSFASVLVNASELSRFPSGYVQIVSGDTHWLSDSPISFSKYKKLEFALWFGDCVSIPRKWSTFTPFKHNHNTLY